MHKLFLRKKMFFFQEDRVGGNDKNVFSQM